MTFAELLNNSRNIATPQGPSAMERARTAVGDFMRGDGDGTVDWRYLLLGAPAVEGASRGLAKGYLAAMEPALSSSWATSAGRKDYRKLLNSARSELGDKYPYLIRNILPAKPGRNPGAYNSLAQVVHVRRGGGSLGTLAHELGHAGQTSSSIRRALLSRVAPAVGIGGSLSSGDRQDSLAWAGLGTLGSIPMLHNELNASMRGGKLLKGIGKSRLGAFVGLPTYAAMAAMPMATHLTKDWLGGFDRPLGAKTASLKDMWDAWDPTGAKAQKQRDMGTAGILAGAGIMADTAYGGYKATRIGDRMISQHKRMLANPVEELLTTSNALRNLKTYGQNAGELAKVRILGIPAGRIFQAMPPAAGTQGNFMDVFKRVLGSRSGLSSGRLDEIANLSGHYGAFMKDPQHALLKELVTTQPFTAGKTRPAVFRAGLRQDELIPLMSPRTKDPLMEFERMVNIRKPGVNNNANALVSRLSRHLFAASTSGHNIRKGLLDTEKALSFGPSGYGRFAVAAGRKLLPIGAVGAAGLGALGLHRLNKDHDLGIKMGSVPWNGESWERPGIADYGINTALLGGGAGLMRRGWQYRPSDLITVTGGRLTPPLVPIDIGAGHVTPAKGIYEALQAHPAVRSGEFTADIALREMQPDAHAIDKQFKGQGILGRARNRALQKPLALSRGAEHGKGHSLVTVDAGFGATNGMHALGIGRKPEFGINPAGVTLFFPDSRLGYGVPNAVMFGNAPGLLHKKQKMLTFGEGNPTGSPLISSIGHYPVHPAIQDSVLRMAEERLGKATPNRKIWLDAAQKLKDSGYLDAHKGIMSALEQNKLMVPFSGSARGDYVTQRVHEGMTALKATDPELYKRVQPVALMGADYGETGMRELLNRHGTIMLPNTNKFYSNGSQGLFDLTGAGDFHMGSTGASAHAEARLAKSPSGYIADYGPTKRREQVLFKNRMTPEWLSGRKAVDLDSWNSGTLRDVKRNKGGIFNVTTPADFVKAMQDVAAGKIGDRTEHAKEYLRMARDSKAQMADAIVRHARDLRSRTTGMMARRMGAGGLMAALGGAGLMDAINRSSASTGDLFKRRIDGMFR